MSEPIETITFHGNGITYIFIGKTGFCWFGTTKGTESTSGNLRPLLPSITSVEDLQAVFHHSGEFIDWEEYGYFPYDNLVSAIAGAIKLKEELGR